MADDSRQVVLREFRAMLVKMTGCRDSLERELICTPCGGCYNSVEAWVVMVNGSPARGVIYIGQSFDGDIYLIDQRKSRRLGYAQQMIVEKFQTHFLGGRHQALRDAATVSIPGGIPRTKPNGNRLAGAGS